MFGSKLLVAVGALVISAGSAMAQFGGHAGHNHGYQYGYGQPGGIRTQQAITNPYTGNTVINKNYVNPYTGVQAQKQIFIPGGGPVYANPAFGGMPAQLIPPTPQFGPNPFIRPVPVFVPQQPVFIQPQPFGGVNLNVQRPGFGININLNNLFR